MFYWWVRRPTASGRTIRMAAALLRGTLRWRRLPAPKRAMGVGFQTARIVNTPSGCCVTGRECFYAWRSPTHQASIHGTTTSQNIWGLRVPIPHLTLPSLPHQQARPHPCVRHPRVPCDGHP